MHDGGPVITTKYMWIAFWGAFLHALMVIGWTYMFYLVSTTPTIDTQIFKVIREIVCGFFAGWNLADTIKYVKKIYSRA